MPSRSSLAELFEKTWSGQALSLRDLKSRTEISRLSLLKHPLGFLHSVIERDGDYAMRLHIWPEGERPHQSPFWPIHNHRFDIVSSILCGSLENRFYSLQPSKTNPTHRLYRVEYVGRGSVLYPTEIMVEVAECGSQSMTARTRYVIGAGLYHQSDIAADCFTATLALTKDVLDIGSIFTAGEITAERNYEYDRSPLTQAEHSLVIKQLMDHCDDHAQ